MLPGDLRSEDAANEAEDDDGVHAGREREVGLQPVECSFANGGVGVGEREPLLSPGLAGSNGRHLQPVTFDGRCERVAVEEVRVSDGELDTVVAELCDPGEVLLEVALQGGGLELRRLR